MAKILIIEDDDDIRDLMMMTLKMKGYEIITANNGPQGVHAAEEQRPDLIICDIMIPLLSGYEVFKRLSEAGIVPRTAFIFASALVRGNDVRLGLQMGADDYLAKPFGRDELLEMVEDVLNRQHLVDTFDEDETIINDIFLSYSHEDRRYMHIVRDGLQSQGFRVWCDEEIEPSKDWAEALASMITHSYVVVSMLSPNAAQSKWVGRELGFAEANDTRIFPILVHGQEKHAIPLRLINHQFIDAREEIDESIIRLGNGIREYLEG